jgi:DMSO/TMAO reductase YedYZ molybdopterin-dependent catalytic subunit
MPSPNLNQLRQTLIANNATRRDLESFDNFAGRRRFLGLSGGTAITLLFGGPGLDAALQGLFGRGLIPVAWANSGEAAEEVPGKPGISVLTARPLTGEFAPHLLDDDVTPNERHYVRNNAEIPNRATEQSLHGWSLSIDGEVDTPLKLSMDDLKKLPAVTLQLIIECGGNGRAFFDPPVRGNQWTYGAVACSKWTGVRLRDILNRAGVKKSAVYSAHFGEDTTWLNEPFSRGIPIDKAMEEHTLVAYEMNDKPIIAPNGFPVRLVVPGWVGSASQKWLTRIWVRDQVHDSQKMSGYSYRIPKHPITPGTRPKESEMEIATSWPVKSLITRPASGTEYKTGQSVEVAGHAWAGEQSIDKVLVSNDYGIHWTETDLKPAPNKYAWQRWQTNLIFQNTGYYEIWARAFDDHGNAQPFRQPWNPKGYLGNVIHRLPIMVS